MSQKSYNRLIIPSLVGVRGGGSSARGSRLLVQRYNVTSGAGVGGLRALSDGLKRSVIEKAPCHSAC